MLRQTLATRPAFLAGLLLLVFAESVYAQPSRVLPGPAGAWEITGVDAHKAKWTGELVLTRGDDGSLAGSIDWTADGASGRENVTATYDRTTRVLSVTGKSLEDASGLVLGTYSAELSADGARLEKGKWGGDIPGSWKAERTATAAELAARGPRQRTGFVHKQFTTADGTKSDYVLFVPHNYHRVKEVPVILFLHGSGETKGEGAEPVDVGLGTYVRQHARTFPYLVVIPQAVEEGWRPRGPNGAIALGILDKTLQDYRTDAKRVYLTGLSMGGAGTWNFANFAPDRWAAIVPICGWGRPDWAETLKPLPCWIFHGAADEVIDVSESREMVAALKKAGAKPQYTEFPKLGHACWDRAYATPELWTWLAEQRRK